MGATTRETSSAIRAALRKTLPETLIDMMARETGAVKRQGKVRIYTFVWALVLGFAIGDKRTLAGLRRSYERAADHTIEESAFYKRFTPELVVLLKALLAHAFAQLEDVGRALRGPLSRFRDVLITDSTVVRLHDLLSSAFAACRTNHTKAALKAHEVMSVRLRAFIGAALMPQLGLFRSLMVFGLLQALSNLSFIVAGLGGEELRRDGGRSRI